MGKQLKKRAQQAKSAPENRPASGDFVQVNLPLDEDPILLSREQVCQILGGISRSTLYRMEKTGELNGCRVDLAGVVRYHKQALARWIAARVKAASAV